MYCFGFHEVADLLRERVIVRKKVSIEGEEVLKSD